MANANAGSGWIQDVVQQMRLLLVEGLSSRKVRRFAVYGGLGCLLGGILGELLLWATRPPAIEKPTVQALCLLIDSSGSMISGSGSEAGRWNNKMEEVQAAAVDFVRRQNFSNGRIAVVAFDSNAYPTSPQTDKVTQLEQAIQSLRPTGSTAMDLGFNMAMRQLAESPSDERTILLFTDGVPDDPDAALHAAQMCRDNKIKLIAIATGDANTNYLAQITGDRKLVFPVSGGNFGEAFKQAEKVIYGGSLVESSSSQRSMWSSMLLIGAWTALLALGTSLALIARQNMDLRRAPLPLQQAIIGTVGGIGAGLVGGVAGEMLYRAIASGEEVPMLGSLLTQVGRLVGWTLLGALLGRGLAFFIPNLEPRRAWFGGAMGGAFAAVAFIFAAMLGDTLGRLLGAAILGSVIGMMIAIVEAASRRIWLEVRFGPKEMINVNLGSTKVTVGSNNRSCTVFARGTRPMAAAYSLNEGKVTFVDYEKETSITVEAGHERIFGNVTATVRSAFDTGSGVAAAPPPPPPLPQPKPSTSSAKPTASTAAAAPTVKPAGSAGSEPKTIRQLAPPPPPPPKPSRSSAKPTASTTAAAPTVKPAVSAGSEPKTIRPLAPPPPPPPPKKK